MGIMGDIAIKAKSATTPKTSEFKVGEVIEIPDEMLVDDPDNQELYGDYDVEAMSKSIAEGGFVGTLEVHPFDGMYRIEGGHRRRLAGRLAGLKKFPCHINPTPQNDDERIIRLNKYNTYNRDNTPMAIARRSERIFNIMQRNLKEAKADIKGVDGIEQKKAILSKKYKAFGFYLDEEGKLPVTNDLVAREMGITKSTVMRYRNLLKLSEKLQALTDRFAWSALEDAKDLPKEQQDALAERLVKMAELQELTKGVIQAEIAEYKKIPNTKESISNTDEESLVVMKRKPRDASKNISTLVGRLRGIFNDELVYISDGKKEEITEELKKLEEEIRAYRNSLEVNKV